MNLGIQDLEAEYEANSADPVILRQLIGELSHRKTKRAKILALEIEEQNASLAEDGIAENENEDISNHEEEILDEMREWDKKQKVVIEFDGDGSVLVEAGPGAGKTDIACARVARLIEDCGLEASKIFLISFTRAAVKELRDRIESFADNSVNVAGLRIATLDSLTWQVVRGLSGDDKEKMFHSYEGNIASFVNMLESKDNDLMDYIEELEHVIVDEGQDLVGVRSELVISLINHLPGDCGVTVFADSAQAIYGFTNDKNGCHPHGFSTAVERIYDGHAGEFCYESLEIIHRTKDQNLKRLYRMGRQRLNSKRESTIDDWRELKRQVSSCAHGKVGQVKDQNLKDKNNVLVLYRTRGEVLMGSSMLWNEGVEHKLRMSGIPTRIHPWIARTLCDFDEKYLNSDEFWGLWKSRIDTSPVNIHTSVEDAWQILEDNAGDGRKRVNLVRVREILSRSRPPVDFLMDENELPGPVIGTIHSSKGREADVVHLMLPPDNYISERMTASEIAEEERVIYVGASRARKRLMIGNGNSMYASTLKGSSRVFRHKKGKYGPYVQVEIGREGDLDNPSVADQQVSESDAKKLQDWLWINSKNNVELIYRLENSTGRNALYTVDYDGRYVGTLSKRFTSDAYSLAEKVAEKRGLGRLKPRPSIKYIRMTGVSTVVVPTGQRETLHSPYRETGFVLVPVISAFTPLFFNE